MVTLKDLHDNLLKEELKRDYFLSKLNEALDTGNLQLAVEALDKAEDLISSTLPSVKSLKTALSNAKSDTRKLIRIKNKKKAAETTAKLVTFYSKMWNFLSRDLPALTKLLLRDFIDDSVPENKKLGTMPDSADIRVAIIEALKNDQSPWYKKLLTFVTGSSKYVNAVPYLDLDAFAEDFLNLTKEEFGNAIFAIASRVNSLTKPSTFTRTVAAATPAIATPSPVIIPTPAPVVVPPTPSAVVDGEKEVDDIVTSLDNLVGIILEKYNTEPKIVGDILNLKKFIINQLLDGKKFNGIIVELDKIATAS